jgi:hypothetical protein
MPLRFKAFIHPIGYDAYPFRCYAVEIYEIVGCSPGYSYYTLSVAGPVACAEAEIQGLEGWISAWE